MLNEIPGDRLKLANIYKIDSIYLVINVSKGGSPFFKCHLVL